METEDFVVSGTCSEQMYGMCESLWVPDMVSLTFLHCFNAKMTANTVFLFFFCEMRAALTSTVSEQEPEDLFETISQAMLNAVDRDAVSGMGVVVHVM